MLPSPKAATLQPRAWPFLRNAFGRAGYIIVHDNLTAYIILAIFSIIDGALMRNYHYSAKELFSNAYPLTTWLAIIALYFTLAAAMRVRKPEYRMSIVEAFGVTVSYLLVLIATVIGLFCLIVPGIWISTRLALAPFCYILDPGEAPYSGLDAIAASWRLTKAHFWPTMWLLLLQALLLVVPSILIEALALVVFQRSHFSAYFSAPLFLLVNVYVWQVLCLSSIDWTLELRGREQALPGF